MLNGGENPTNTGFFQLFAFNALNESQSILKGAPNGSLEWNTNDLAGAAIVAKSLTTNGYIKYANGLIIQWGSFILTNEQLQKTFPIPISYTTQFYGLYVSNQNGTKRYFAYSNNLANITVGELTGYAADPLMWFSLGK